MSDLAALLQGKLVVSVSQPAPNELDLTLNDGTLVHLAATTESITGAPALRTSWAHVGPAAADAASAQHMLGNIGAVWFGDPNTDLRPHGELLAAARADISVLLRYALPGAYGEDVAVQAAQQAAALWREAHDALLQLTTTAAEDAAGLQLATVRLSDVRAQLEAHGLVRPAAVVRTLETGVAETLVTPPPPPEPEPFDHTTLPWVRCNSSNVLAYALPVQGATVHVQYKDGAVYEYHDVPGSVREGLADVATAGGSVGSYIHARLTPYAVGRVA